jgi:ABC-type nitrate/sulfonate/bicarbonate transport system substrate-binding protein
MYGFQVAKPVLDIRKGEGPRMLRDYAYNSMVAREDYLAAHPDVARRMVEAVVDTQRFLQDPKNFEETVKIAEKYFEGIDPRLLRQILQDGIKAYQPVITRQAVANIGEMLAGAGLIKRPLVFEDIVDTRFAPTKFP